MRKFIVFFIFVLFFSVSSHAMIDTFAFTLKAKVISTKPWPMDENRKTLNLNPQYEMDIEILEVLSKDARIGPYKEKTKVHIDNAYSNALDLKRIKPGDTITGDFMSIETEMHPAGGYRINREFKITSMISSGKEGKKQAQKLTGNPSSSAESINLFAVGLYSALKGQEGNLFFSPYSISSALAMAYAGAKGETAAQMKKFSCFEPPPDEVIVANALWGQKGYHFKKDFLDILKTQYQSELNQLDFLKEPEKSRKAINKWVEKKTNDKITGLLKPGAIDPTTRLILTNAIYFKSDWAKQFEKEETKEADFFINKKEKARTKMMHQNGHFNYFENNSLQLLELPYKQYKLSMLIILPKKIEGLSSIELNEIGKWLGGLKSNKVNLFLPKFKITSEFSLKETLSSLGMKDAFSSKLADFTAMYEKGEQPLFISDVIHKAYVDVNEDGTEAAAATAVGFAKTSFDPTKPKTFKADHPFIFLIKDNNSGTILFMGKVAKSG